MEVKNNIQAARSVSPRPVSPSPLLMSLISESRKLSTKRDPQQQIQCNERTEKLPVFSVSDDNISISRFSSVNDAACKTANDSAFVSLSQCSTSAFEPVNKPKSESDSTNKTPNKNVQSNFQNSKDMESYRQFVANPQKSSLSAAPSFLSLVRAKLEEEKAKSERPKLQRKITEHDDPLYALVVKETLMEYEQKTLKRQETLKRQKNVIIDDLYKEVPPHCEDSPDFLSIMERKIAEKAVEVMPSIKNETAVIVEESKDATQDHEDSIIKESAYASVLLETLRDYEKLKTEQHLTKKVAKSFGFNFREGAAGEAPNFLSLLEQKLIEKNLIDMNITSHNGGDVDDSIGALIVKGALLENRNRSDNDCLEDERKAEEHAKIHPHHINRPFWSDTTEDKVISTPACSNEDNIFEKAATASLKIKKRYSQDEESLCTITRGKSLDIEFNFPDDDNDGTIAYDDDLVDKRNKIPSNLSRDMRTSTDQCMSHEIHYKGNDFSQKYMIHQEPQRMDRNDTIRETHGHQTDDFHYQAKPIQTPLNEFNRHQDNTLTYRYDSQSHLKTQYMMHEPQGEKDNNEINYQPESYIKPQHLENMFAEPPHEISRRNSQTHHTSMQVIQNNNKDDNLQNTEYETEQEVSYNSNEKVYTVTCHVSPRPQRKNPPVIVEEKPLIHLDKTPNNPEVPNHVFNQVSESNAPPPPIDRSIKPKINNAEQTRTNNNSLQQTFIPPPDYSPISSPKSNSEDEDVFVEQWPNPPSFNNSGDVKQHHERLTTNSDIVDRPRSPFRTHSTEPLTTERKTIKIVEDVKRLAAVGGMGANRGGNGENIRIDPYASENSGNYAKLHNRAEPPGNHNNDKIPLKSHHFAFIHGQKTNQQTSSNTPAKAPVPDRTQKPMKR